MSQERHDEIVQEGVTLGRWRVGVYLMLYAAWCRHVHHPQLPAQPSPAQPSPAQPSPARTAQPGAADAPSRPAPPGSTAQRSTAPCRACSARALSSRWPIMRPPRLRPSAARARPCLLHLLPPAPCPPSAHSLPFVSCALRGCTAPAALRFLAWRRASGGAASVLRAGPCWLGASSRPGRSSTASLAARQRAPSSEGGASAMALTTCRRCKIL